MQISKALTRVGPLFVTIVSGCLAIWLWKIGVRFVSALLMIICIVQIYDQIAAAYNDRDSGSGL